MGLLVLPDELLLSLSDQWSCRDTQLRQLYALLSPSLPQPSNVVVYGSHATGRSGAVSSYLQTSKLTHAIIRCRESVTGRHLLEQTVAAVHDALRNDNDEVYTGRCDSLSTLTTHLERFLQPREDPFVLVFDDIDKQRDAPPTLLPALARIADSIPNLTILYILQHPPPRCLHQTGIPHIQFPVYSRAQSLHILSKSPPDIFLGSQPKDVDYDDETHAEDKAWLWPRFCAAVWDSLAQHAARDLVSFRRLCDKLWRPFVQPIIAGDFGTRDFSRLLVAQRRLLQDETVLLDTIITPTASILKAPSTEPAATTITTTKPKPPPSLPYYTTYLLTAAYLASHNPARTDQTFFMKHTEARKKRRRSTKTATTTSATPSARNTSNIHRNTPRHLLAASPFALDRWLSIFHALLPQPIRAGSLDVGMQIATLVRLRLVVRSGIGGGDVLDAGGKWKVGGMVGWEYVSALAGGVGMRVGDYLAE
ncbi:hypothetical protein MBLNU230_g8617t1 [Neophaeotheca triangularis]